MSQDNDSIGPRTALETAAAHAVAGLRRIKKWRRLEAIVRIEDAFEELINDAYITEEEANRWRLEYIGNLRDLGVTEEELYPPD